ncbi:bifunctional 4-hydroxy-2-oxoglutarate aldolase/2-dehydro-3-deoxy-phosphogluconate aldolase [Echinicola rosea]|uniref:Bifunctional 2-keto-4-hydroxyglutarate aldolase/2-keto-3-deoxy-6-phosphogluconate aldolase n=1 Tax=Echinicola rosea TaxID=1807691 RepID=A0ABQ1VBK4_9BACT|nr:bifunctional 4-hydroxy-2-oxoglutarate aldolase/2-dehydro-3-deoxy-phosphogluconate aldolase [Echinicola rosea]GGF49191.1 bifunctional 2-keto-4-hydroxyglutarate aldolase/2-keto-3-deoxy-6-phosphogluconate aldolase [Echinicola rosea]
MEKEFSEENFKRSPIIGILRGYTLDDTLRIAEVFQKSGLTTLEITLNTPNALEIISKTKQHFGSGLNIGAGTVCNVDDVNNAHQAGAQFMVAPITDKEVIAHCSSINIPIFPGALTPTEIYQAWAGGARMVKLFPGGTFSPSFIKDVLAPLDQIEIMPTGGVTYENMEEFYQAGAKAFGMGNNLFHPDLIKRKEWQLLLDHFVKHKKLIENLQNQF